MRFLVIGSGGREHALAWKLARDNPGAEVHAAPGNGGTPPGFAHPVAADDFEGLADLAQRLGAGLTVVGPDDALAGGAVDVFQSRGLRVFGPSRAAARLEASKSLAKDFMRRHGIPTARAGTFDSRPAALAFCRQLGFPCVIKADGLALGKGVVIAQNEAEAGETLAAILEEGRFGKAGERVVVEEFLEGVECSVHALVSAGRHLMLEPAMDHKRIFEGDRGPNTGGMGTVSPPAFFSAALREEIRTGLLDRFTAGLEADGLDFRGLLFPGLMLTRHGFRVLEFNVRFGDPETQSLMRRLRSPLAELLEAAVEGRLGEARPEWDPRAAACIVAASAGYPGAYAKGVPIHGLPAQGEESPEGVVVFHAGTARTAEGGFVTSGGRVLNVTALGATIAEARRTALRALERIRFEGMQFRRDIGEKAEAPLA